uniref:Uncharacterized protein n=1 Tax=Molossus molossus TaxID=27622 RepID=A0A7J8C8Z7_MOLMO|nr:hypothetical protein HJG59_009962 [Molossus molossus]
MIKIPIDAETGTTFVQGEGRRKRKGGRCDRFSFCKSLLAFRDVHWVCLQGSSFPIVCSWPEGLRRIPPYSATVRLLKCTRDRGTNLNIPSPHHGFPSPHLPPRSSSLSFIHLTNTSEHLLAPPDPGCSGGCRRVPGRFRNRVNYARDRGNFGQGAPTQPNEPTFQRK